MIINLSRPFARLKFRCTGALTLFLFFFSNGCTAPGEAAHLLYRNWDIRDGLPHNRLHALFQSQDGFMWIGTAAGVVRFDGVRFSPPAIPLPNKDKVTACYQAANQVLWMGTEENGVYGLAENQWRHYSTSNGLSHNHITAIVGDQHGHIWVATEYGLNCIDGESISIYTVADGLMSNLLTSLAVDSSGDLWVGSLQGGLARLEQNRFQCFNFNQGLLNLDVFSLFYDLSGMVYVGAMDGLYAFSLKTMRFEFFPATSGIPIKAIVRDHQGSLWLAAWSDGLWRINGKTTQRVHLEEAYDEDYIHALYIDRQGSLWIGTDSHGLVQAIKPDLSILNRADGLPENKVTTLIKASDKCLWIGTPHSGLVRYVKPGTVERIDRRKGLNSDRITALAEDNSGCIWIGTDVGLYCHKKNMVSNIALPDSRSISIRAIACLASNKIFIATARELFSIDGYSSPSTGQRIVHDSISVSVLCPVDDRTIYVGGKNGLDQLEIRQFQWQLVEHWFSGVHITAIFYDADGTLYLGTDGRGLIRKQRDQVVYFTKDQGLPDNTILSICRDSSGRFWFSSPRGVFHIDQSRLSTQQDEEYLIFTLYDEFDGLPGTPGDGEAMPAMWQDGDQLYYPTMHGAAIFNARRELQQPAANAYIEKIRVDDEWFSADAEFGIGHRVQLLEIHFTAADFISPQKLRFRFRLSDYDKQERFLPPGQPRFVQYINLPPGRYRFNVQVISNSGIAGKGDEVSFIIPLPWYRRAWIYVLFLLATGAAWLVYFRKTRKPVMKYQTSSLDPQRALDVLPRLQALMDDKKAFLDADLNLQRLAQQLKIHPNYLSQIIHEQFNLNYNDFINSYRIKEAQQRLARQSGEKASVTEIMLDCGFFSKSAFNTAFKKFVGMTPSEYRKSR